MSSWIKCPCGNAIHRNLFAGAKVFVLVEDSVLDQINDDLKTADAVTMIVMQSDILVKCGKCGRILIEENKTNEIKAYLPERVS